VVRNLPRGVEATVDHLSSTIIVSAALCPERRSFSVAHEAGEISKPLGLPEEINEAWCDRFAAALMMPARPFVDSALSCGLRLPVLSRFWRHCSKPAILTRISDLFPNTRASSWRRNRPSFRRGFALSPAAAEIEAFCAAEAAYQRRESWVQEGQIAARAWPAGEDRALVLCVAA